jgi:hypothetical protein
MFNCLGCDISLSAHRFANSFCHICRFAEKCYDLFSSDFEEEFVVEREKEEEKRRGLSIPISIRSAQDTTLTGWAESKVFASSWFLP